MLGGVRGKSIHYFSEKFSLLDLYKKEKNDYMRRVSVRKRGKVYQYQFEIGTINGKRKFINKSGFKT